MKSKIKNGGVNPLLAAMEKPAYYSHMSFDTLITEVQALPADARRKLMAFMVALQDEGREGYAAKLAAKIDDKSPDRWLTAEQCEQKLGLPGGSE